MIPIKRKNKKDYVPFYLCSPAVKITIKNGQEIKTEIKSKKDPAYKEYLKSKKWKILRSKRLRKDKYKCKKCGKKATQVHHLTYCRIYNEYLSDLISLCTKCHKRLHNK